MICPYCGSKTMVTYTVTDKEESVVYRYRKCLNNKYHRFRTSETVICEKKEELKND